MLQYKKERKAAKLEHTKHLEPLQSSLGAMLAVRWQLVKMCPHLGAVAAINDIFIVT